jgi:hypothetical protein
VEAWLVNLDLMASEVLAIITKHGVKAGELFKLFQTQTGNLVMSSKEFGTRVTKLVDQGRGPLGARVHRRDGEFYQVKSM